MAAGAGCEYAHPEFAAKRPSFNLRLAAASPNEHTRREFAATVSYLTGTQLGKCPADPLPRQPRPRGGAHFGSSLPVGPPWEAPGPSRLPSTGGALGSGSWGPAARGRSARSGVGHPVPFLADGPPVAVAEARNSISRIVRGAAPCVSPLGVPSEGCTREDELRAPFWWALDREPGGRVGIVSLDAGGMCSEPDGSSSLPDGGKAVGGQT